MQTYGNITVAALYLILAGGYVSMLHIQGKILNLLVRILLIMSIAAHLFVIIFIGATRGIIALSTVFEALSALALFLAMTLLVLELRSVEKSFGAFIVPLIFIMQLISAFESRIPVLDNSIVKMPLFTLHTITTIIGYTFFIYSFILGIMHLYLINRFNRRKYDDLFFELPPLEIIEKLNFTVLLTGFIFLSIGLSAGFYLSVIIWKILPFSDPKILLSIVLWVVYLLSLVAIVIFKVKGKMMSYCAIIGFLLIIVIFLIEIFTNTTLHKF